jgi:uncharacterized membrane protein
MNPKQIFLIDSLGAFLSSFLLGLITLKFHNIFGLPKAICCFLAILALLFAIYSLTCHYFIKKKWRRFLLFIIIANMSYCFLTIGLIFNHFDSITTLGLTYFILEVIIIIALVFIEIKIYTNP